MVTVKVTTRESGGDWVKTEIVLDKDIPHEYMEAVVSMLGFALESGLTEGTFTFRGQDVNWEIGSSVLERSSPLIEQRIVLPGAKFATPIFVGRGYSHSILEEIPKRILAGEVRGHIDGVFWMIQ